LFLHAKSVEKGIASVKKKAPEARVVDVSA
jgi:uncharacterized protein YegP (UPF0339 family)